MRPEEEAYAIAEQRIAEAKASGARYLCLAPYAYKFENEEYEDEPKLNRLARVPPALTDLTNLTRLDLQGTQVANLAPLAGLTALQTLWLDGTQVADLSPLKNLSVLEQDARRGGGLFIANCPNITDPVLRDLAEKDNLERTVETLAYLRGEGAGSPQSAPPEPSRGGPVFEIPDEGPIRLI